MNDPVRFLLAFGHALAAMARHPHGHPTREHAVDEAYDELDALCDGPPLHGFTFLGDEVLFGRQPLRALTDWEWSARLADVGIERLDVERRVSRDELRALLEYVRARLDHAVPGSAALHPLRPLGIRLAAIGPETYEAAAVVSPGALGLGLDAEADVVRWLHRRAESGRALPQSDIDAVVRSLLVTMHAGPTLVVPLLRLDDLGAYVTTHALNVSMLAMALTESLGGPQPDILALGVAGLLHDIGMVRVPADILTKPGPLSTDNWRTIHGHPAEGARILMQGPSDLGLAALVAYEHQQRLDGSGYPHPLSPGDISKASRLIQVCDVYDALCSKRPHRDAWAADRAVTLLHEQAGIRFDPAFVSALVALLATERVDMLPGVDAGLPTSTSCGHRGALANPGIEGTADEWAGSSDELIIEFE